jgi:hypothetical protein
MCVAFVIALFTDRRNVFSLFAVTGVVEKLVTIQNRAIGHE